MYINSIKAIFLTNIKLPSELGVRLYWPLLKGKLGTGETLQEKAYSKILSNNMHVRVPMMNTQ